MMIRFDGFVLMHFLFKVVVFLLSGGIFFCGCNFVMLMLFFCVEWSFGWVFLGLEISKDFLIRKMRPMKKNINWMISYLLKCYFC